MKKYIKSENGYSLVTVMLIFILITALGLTLVSVTVGSSKFVAFDRVSAEDRVNAENRMEEAMANIENEVDIINGEALNASNALSKMDSALAKAAAKGASKYTLSHETLRNGENGVFIKKVSIDTPLGNSGKRLKKTVTLSTISEIFQYSLVSPGIIEFNGASYIEGDVTAKNIVNRSEAKFIKNSTYWKPTSYPAIKGSLALSDNENGFYYYNNGAKRFTPNASNLNKYFSVVPRIKTSKPTFDKLQYSRFIKDVDFNLNTQKTEEYCYRNWLGKWVCEEKNSSFSRKESIDGTKFRGNLTIEDKGDLTVNGNLVVTKKLTIKKGGKLNVNGSVIIEGDATLSGQLALGSKENYIYINSTTSVDNFDFEGKMFIDSNLTIKNDFNTNGTVFIRNTVDVQNLSNNSGGTLVLIADGDLKLSNNNQYVDEPKTIDAFLYTNSTLEMYGVGSNMKILGGMYGNSIILNATKGKTYTSGSKSTYDELGGLYFQKNQNSIDPTKSRLSIIYKKELILNPPTGIPTVDKVQIKELDSSFE